MTEAFTIALYVAMGAVVAVLIAGVASMFKGGAFNKRYGNRLMRMRVALQALAIGLLALLVLVINRK